MRGELSDVVLQWCFILCGGKRKEGVTFFWQFLDLNIIISFMVSTLDEGEDILNRFKNIKDYNKLFKR